MFLTFIIADNSLVERMIQLHQDFEKEVAIEHRSIFLWKIQLSKFFQKKKNFQQSNAIVFKLFKQLVNKKGFEDVKLELCVLLSLLNREILLKQINEHYLESHSSKLKYFTIKFVHYLQKRNFDESEKWLTKFEQECRKYNFCYYKPYLVLRKSWLLYWKSQFNEALVLLEDMDEGEKKLFSTFYLFKSLMLLKLGKFVEAESVFDGESNFDLLESLSLSFVKFMKHDFSGAKELLESWKIDIGINNILDYVCLYEMKWFDFSQKKNSSSLNQGHEVLKSLKECVEMKKIVIEMYDDYFRHNFCFNFSWL